MQQKQTSEWKVGFKTEHTVTGKGSETTSGGQMANVQPHVSTEQVCL